MVFLWHTSPPPWKVPLAKLVWISTWTLFIICLKLVAWWSWLMASQRSNVYLGGGIRGVVLCAVNTEALSFQQGVLLHFPLTSYIHRLSNNLSGESRPSESCSTLKGNKLLMAIAASEDLQDVRVIVNCGAEARQAACLTWSELMSIGVLQTIQVTLSSRGGVVREPSYVQYSRLSGSRVEGSKPVKPVCLPWQKKKYISRS